MSTRRSVRGGRWVRTALRFAIPLAGSAAAARLWQDATLFALYAADPATGRVRGCYTRIERMLGLTHPEPWIRSAEVAASVALLILSLAFFILFPRLTDRRLRTRGSDPPHARP